MGDYCSIVYLLIALLMPLMNKKELAENIKASKVPVYMIEVKTKMARLNMLLLQKNSMIKLKKAMKFL